MRRVTGVLMVVALAALGTAGFATAEEPEGPAPTTVQAVDAAVEGSAVAVAADIAFGGQAPVVLGDDPAGDGPVDATAADAFGVDLTEIRAYRSDPTDPVVTLEWQTTNLERLPPPEIIRYYWQFVVDGAVISAQAKTTDFVSAANAGDGQPGTVASNLQSYGSAGVPGFRIRGNCELIGGTLNNCGHVAWVDGEFDFDNDVVRFFLPLDLEALPKLRPGAKITPDANGAYAAFQAAADNANTRDTVTQWEDYVVPDATATARLLDAAGAVVASGALSQGDDGRWSGGLTAPAPGDYRLEVRACFADNCDISVTDLVVS